MIKTYLTALALMIVITGAWLTVQRLWRRQFPGQEEDALANRSGCHNCSCAPGSCQREPTTPDSSNTEVSRDAP